MRIIRKGTTVTGAEGVTSFNGRTGAVTPAAGDYTMAQVGGSNPNLLHNWDFTNPVNQRGESSYSGTGIYTIDRWKTFNASVTVNLYDNVSLSRNYGLFGQMVDNYGAYKGKTITFSVDVSSYSGNDLVLIINDGVEVTGASIVSNGITKVTRTISNSAPQILVGIQNNSLTTTETLVPLRAKLERGSVSTLANDSPADYWEQLMLCQRYAVKITSPCRYRAAGVAANYIDFVVPVPATMVTEPYIPSGMFAIRQLSGNSNESGFTFSIAMIDSGSVLVQGTKTSHGLTDAKLYVLSDGVLSADL